MGYSEYYSQIRVQTSIIWYYNQVFLYELFPHQTSVNYYKNCNFVASGDLNGNQLRKTDEKCFKVLSSFHKQMNEKFASASKEFVPEHAAEKIEELAKKYSILGGNWILFLKDRDVSRFKGALNLLIDVVSDDTNWQKINQFNAKISKGRLIVSYGNEYSLASTDPSLIQSMYSETNPDREFIEAKEKSDTGVCHVLEIINKMYNQKILGPMVATYKPHIFSVCCIQRGNVIRPTVYQHYYGSYVNDSFRSPHPHPHYVYREEQSQSLK